MSTGRMEKLLRFMAEKNASDLFLSAGSPVQIKMNGVTRPINEQLLDPAMVESLIREILTDRQWQSYDLEHELNIGYGLRDAGSFRVNVFQQRGTPAAVVRFIPGTIPSLKDLNLPEEMADLVLEKRGLLLMVGATGSGKSTSLAAMIDHRNENKPGHILTLEDPIEFTFKNKRSIVNQRQIGTDTSSIEIALKNAMRQAPDCILIGEIRDTNAMSMALAYAQSGHLVLATMHANNSNHALNRIISFYSPENRRALLSDMAATLKAVVSQRLVKSVDGGRLPAVEVMLNTRLIAELIEQARLTEIKDAMEKSLAPGSVTFDQSLARLVRENLIRKEDAMANADSPSNLLWNLENVAAPETDTPKNQADMSAGTPRATLAGKESDELDPIAALRGVTDAEKAEAEKAESNEGNKSDKASFSDFLLNV
ncbi:MAG: PilT/PilU family type 4a pilus ATPase [Burkholderiaceae bacterium]